MIRSQINFWSPLYKTLYWKNEIFIFIFKEKMVMNLMMIVTVCWGWNRKNGYKVQRLTGVAIYTCNCSELVVGFVRGRGQGEEKSTYILFL